MNIKTKSFREYKFEITLFLIYVLCHGGIFFILNSIYWDDWVLFNSDKNVIITTFKQAGGSFFNYTGYMHSNIIPIGQWIYKVATFVLYFFSSIILYQILLENKKFEKSTSQIITIFFLILPLNSARVALIDFPYTIGYFLFFLAWKIKNHRLLSLVIFFFSFNINSLPFLYILFIIDLYFEKNNHISIENVKQFIKNKIDFILLPILFFYIKYNFFKTSGLYKTYNSNFSFINIFITPIRQIIDLSGLNINLFLFLAVFSIIIFLKPFYNAIKKTEYKNNILTLLSILLALFPYWILGLTPTFVEWSSRHQLLMPLGVSLLLVQIITKFSRYSRYLIFTIFISISIVMNLNNYFNFFVDWNKQKAIMNLLAKNIEIKDKKLVLINDHTLELNALSRNYRFYEWNGLFKYVYKDENRFVMNYSDKDLYNKGLFDIYFNEFGNAKDFKKANLKDATIINIDKVDSKTNLDKFIGIFKPNLTLQVCK
jgi:hypothetical protein